MIDRWGGVVGSWSSEQGSRAARVQVGEKWRRGEEARREFRVSLMVWLSSPRSFLKRRVVLACARDHASYSGWRGAVQACPRMRMRMLSTDIIHGPQHCVVIAVVVAAKTLASKGQERKRPRIRGRQTSH